jgi:hypothetical protein
MSGEGESDDSTTIRRKILLSPTMPPRDSTDHNGSPLAHLIGQVRLLNPLLPPSFEHYAGQCLERNPALRPKVGDVKKHAYFSTV